MLNKILLRKIKFPLSWRGAFSFCHSRDFLCHSRESGNPSSLSFRGAKQRSNLKGFSLIELMVAVVILSIAIFGIFQAYSIGFMGMADARDRTVATNYAQEAMENIKNMDFELITEGNLSIPEIFDGKFTRIIIIEENVEGSPNLKKVKTIVSWKNRNENENDLFIETSMLINKIEFLPKVATRLLIYVTPYNIIFPNKGSINLIAVIKDAEGNTVTNWDKNITFTIMGITIDGVIMEEGEISCYLKNENSEQGSLVQGDIISVNPINGIAKIKLYTGEESTLAADQIGNINVEAQTTSVDEEVFIDSVDIKVTQGAVKIDLISKQDLIETNTIKIDSNTKIIATLVDANGDQVLEGEAEVNFIISGKGSSSDPLTGTTENQQISITLTASNTPGVATVTASANNLLPDTIKVYVTGPPVSINVVVSPNSIYLDQTAEVTVTLKDINGVTVDAESDVNISFSLSPVLGVFTDDTITIYSGSSSNFTTFTPTVTGNSTIQATATGLTAGTAAITIADTLVAHHIEVSASHDGIEAGGNNPSVITAVIKSAEPENATVYSYSGLITFTTTKGSFSATNSGITEITLTNGSGENTYQNGIASIDLYSNSDDTSGVATITVTSGILTEGSTEVIFYVEADHIELSSIPDQINIFGKEQDTCNIVAIIKDISGNTVENYVGTVTFSVIEGSAYGQFVTSGNAIVTVINGQASIDLRSKCDTGTVIVKATSTLGDGEIISGPLSVTVNNGGTRNIGLVSGSVSQPSTNSVSFNIQVTDGELNIRNMKITNSFNAKLTEIKIDELVVYSGSINDGEIVDILFQSSLSVNTHNINFTYSKNVNNKNFTAIFNAQPDCGFLNKINFST